MHSFNLYFCSRHFSWIPKYIGYGVISIMSLNGIFQTFHFMIYTNISLPQFWRGLPPVANDVLAICVSPDGIECDILRRLEFWGMQLAHRWKAPWEFNILSTRDVALLRKNRSSFVECSNEASSVTLPVPPQKPRHQRGVSLPVEVTPVGSRCRTRITLASRRSVNAFTEITLNALKRTPAKIR